MADMMIMILVSISRFDFDKQTNINKANLRIENVTQTQFSRHNSQKVQSCWVFIEIYEYKLLSTYVQTYFCVQIYFAKYIT